MESKLCGELRVSRLLRKETRTKDFAFSSSLCRAAIILHNETINLLTMHSGS